MKNKGFTLVELAIVLVIIGLLVGGVLQGQELIRQAQIRNVIASIDQMDVAVNTFRAKYNNALPGDMAQADAFGVDRPGGTGTLNATENDEDVTNGNGDGSLDPAAASDPEDWDGERMNFFVHLANTNLVKGGFSQATASTAVGVAYPQLPIGNGMIALTEAGATSLNYILGVGASVTVIEADTGLDLTLTPEVAYAIDIKKDDGVPTSGIVQALDDFTDAEFVAPTAGADAVTGCWFDDLYNYTVTTQECSLRVRASS